MSTIGFTPDWVRVEARVVACHISSRGRVNATHTASGANERPARAGGSDTETGCERRCAAAVSAVG